MIMMRMLGAGILGIGMPGGWEWLIIALAVVLFFGAKRIPELARGLGRGIREFKDATRGIEEDIQESVPKTTKTKPTTTKKRSPNKKGKPKSR